MAVTQSDFHVLALSRAGGAFCIAVRFATLLGMKPKPDFATGTWVTGATETTRCNLRDRSSMERYVKAFALPLMSSLFLEL